MKNLNININKSIVKLFAGLMVIISLVACDKSIDENELQTLIPNSNDESGGNWDPIVISSPSAITIPAPVSTTSDEYKAELQELKAATSNLTDKQKSAVKYWSAGGVLRWNEIIRELIAKYNLAAVANPDGTYPGPDASKPTNYPEFPFANPPYTGRALALLSVAQYDALIATWHYKYQMNRPVPSSFDSGIKTLFPASTLPSYPSEEAVIASVSLELMKFLFPGDVAFLTAKAEEQKNAQMWGGASVKSDVAAGDSLGRKIAAEIINFGKNDGMKNAGKFTPEMMETQSLFAKNNFGIAWKSLEVPARPPMLPSFGTIKNWLFDDVVKISIRPPAPPKIGSAEFEKDLNELRGLSENITREQFRIVSYWADGTGTYTPPGHWNKIAADLIAKNKFSELRTSRTFALLNMALADAGVCCWETKYYYYVPRPSQVDPKIKTATGVPNFPSYTSGHSTYSGAASTVLSYIFPAERSKLESMALEASVSRIYGGIHYRFDCEAGLKCGKDIGQFAVNLGKSDGSGQ